MKKTKRNLQLGAEAIRVLVGSERLVNGGAINTYGTCNSQICSGAPTLCGGDYCTSVSAINACPSQDDGHC